MALTQERLKETGWITNSATSMVEAAASESLFIRTVILHNTHTSAIEVQLWMCPANSGSPTAAADQYQIFRQTLSSYETVQIDIRPPGLLLDEDGDALQAKAGTTDKVTCTVTGFKVT